MPCNEIQKSLEHTKKEFKRYEEHRSVVMKEAVVVTKEAINRKSHVQISASLGTLNQSVRVSRTTANALTLYKLVKSIMQENDDT